MAQRALACGRAARPPTSFGRRDSGRGPCGAELWSSTFVRRARRRPGRAVL